MKHATQMDLPIKREAFVPVMSCREALQRLRVAVLRYGLAHTAENPDEDAQGETALALFEACDIADAALAREDYASHTVDPSTHATKEKEGGQ
jgi:hypothetical protein